MSVVFKADDGPTAVQQDYWRHVLREVVGPLDPHGAIRPGSGHPRLGQDVAVARVLDAHWATDAVMG